MINVRSIRALGIATIAHTLSKIHLHSLGNYP
jgi:hypothetical protein